MANVYIKRLDESFEFEPHEDSKEFAADYGFKQWLADRFAGVTLKSCDGDEELMYQRSREAVLEGIDRLVAGDIPGYRATRRRPMTAEAKKGAEVLAASPEVQAQIAALLAADAARPVAE